MVLTDTSGRDHRPFQLQTPDPSLSTGRLPKMAARHPTGGGVVLVAAFNKTTGWQGRTISREGDTFLLEGRGPIIVTRKASLSVVNTSLDDYEALEETAWLLRSTRNARRLFEA